MIDFFLAPENIPFSIAIALMLAIAFLEGVGMIIGLGFSNLIDSVLPEFDSSPDIDIDAGIDIDGVGDTFVTPSPFTKLMAWLQVGKVPFLILMIIFLTTFGFAGFVLQSLIKSVLTFYLPWFIAIIPAIIIALPIVRVSGNLIARIIPQDETSAVSEKSFIGQIATVSTGKAEKGNPAQAKLKDKFGQTHYILVEPESTGEAFEQGSEVLVIKQSGSLFTVIANPSSSLSDNTL
ncbi:MAG: hypothetical protein SCALA702_20010 [Melioribacteraceae bacterium]|nr:MAG: hypothetical protein SCALA702_20010 [Melioribacteraceae bacterium]